MSTKCLYCSKSINPEHDKHYYCKCGKKRKVVCKQCYLSHHKCSDCGKKFHFHDESILEKAYHNPATRNGLGF